MEPRWSKKYDKCQQCGTKRFPQIAKGLCGRCYRLVNKLERVNHWDLSNPDSLKGYPREAGFHKLDTFIQVKEGVAAQIRERLAFLKARELMLESTIDGIDVEHILRDIARRCHVKNRNLFFGIAGYIDDNFKLGQKKVLYELLNEIEEDIPWKGTDWNKVFERR